MPKGSAVEKVEKKLKKEYPGNDRAVYGTLNKIGLMKGSKTTAKGAKPAAKKPGPTNVGANPAARSPIGKPIRKRRLPANSA